MYKGLIDRYKKYLPVNENTEVVTLYEGNTPLIPVPELAKIAGFKGEIYVKYEGLNPTGSFKDRGMTMAVTKAKEDGMQVVMCASTGNTSASAAAYAARCGMKSVVLIPDGNIALGKLAQSMIYGAKVVAVDGNFDDCLKYVRELCQKHPIALVNSINPYRLEGQKTAAFEIVDDLSDAPDYLLIPVGNAGNISAYFMGFNQYLKEGISTKLPKMWGMQAAGAAPIVENRVFENPETVATAIRIGNPASWDKAVNARDQSKGRIEKVSDEEILEAYKLIAKNCGVFCEPASAASVAGFLKYGKGIETGSKVVMVLTGNGLKDPDNAIKQAPEIFHVQNDITAIEEVVL
ncbi:MAG: threonine synthase [Firmicutes bacterium]|nr:threonine synthase [Bacillota bacterium]MDD4263766.1 threonine synthase [Bacillota bacterium]MDD4693098.1 threonine synthase [Bacillota bacterium]